MPALKNPRQEQFAQNIVNDMTTVEAYQKAGYKATGHSAEQASSRLLASAGVRERLGELYAPAVKAAELSAERVLRELTRLAFYDMTDIIQPSAGKITMRDPTLLPEDLRRAITRIKPVWVGNQFLYECRFADKQKALESLGRHLQMFKDTLVVENVFRIVNEMDDDELDRRLTELERAFRQATALDSAAGEGTARLH